MKQIKLLKLELTNYRNIEHEVYVFDGSNAKIVGENRIGKTNTLEAIYFLLSDYLLDGSSELANIKPLSDTKKEVRVEGTFLVDDRELKLAKCYGESWVKKRGSEELVMQGHYEDYYVNGFKQSKARDYFNLLQEYFGVRNDEKGEVDTIQMLINPLYLGNLGESKDWTKLRTFIVKLIGDVEDKEVFEKAPQTKIIEQDLTNALGRTDNLKKQLTADIDTLNMQLVGFDSQVELLEKTDKPSDEDVVRAKEQMEAINGKIDELKNNSGKDSVVEQLEREIFELEKVIVAEKEKEFKAFVESTKNSEEAKNKAEIDELNKKVNSLVNKKSDISFKIKEQEMVLNNYANEHARLVKEYREIESHLDDIDNHVASECPTCHRPFSESELKDQKETIREHNRQALSEIFEKGTLTTKVIKETKDKIEKLEKEQTKIETELARARDELELLNNTTFEKPIFVESDNLKALKEKEAKLKEELTARKEKVSEKASDNYDVITKLEEDRCSANKVIEDRNYYDRQMSLLEGVKAERKEVSSKLIETEQKKEALKTYIYTKLRLLDEHIAKVFGKLRFQLIKENINGGFDPVCKPYIYDVDKDQSTSVLWKNGSKSEKIITGIAIVEAIRKELDLTELPYLFDEGGEISNETLRNKFKTNAQIICVRVEDNILKPIVVKF